MAKGHEMDLMEKMIKERGLEEQLKAAELELAVSEALWKAAEEERRLRKAIFSVGRHIWKGVKQ